MKKIGYFLVTFNDAFSFSIDLDFSALYEFYTALQIGHYAEHGAMEKIELCYFSLPQNVYLHTEGLRLLYLALKSGDTPLWLLAELSTLAKQVVEDNYWTARGLTASYRSHNDLEKLAQILA